MNDRSPDLRRIAAWLAIELAVLVALPVVIALVTVPFVSGDSACDPIWRTHAGDWCQSWRLWRAIPVAALATLAAAWGGRTLWPAFDPIEAWSRRRQR